MSEVSKIQKGKKLAPCDDGTACVTLLTMHNATNASRVAALREGQPQIDRLHAWTLTERVQSRSVH